MHRRMNMEASYSYATFITVMISTALLFFYRRKTRSPLPPGSFGWPLIGETLDFFARGRRGDSGSFIFDRVVKYSSPVFKTHLFGARGAFFSGAEGNKLLFSNENKLVQAWRPSSVAKIFPYHLKTSTGHDLFVTQKMLPHFLKSDALCRYVGAMDEIARSHFADEWETKESVVVSTLAKKYTSAIVCRVLMSVEDPAKFAAHFEVLTAGLFSVPVDFPGTPLNRAIRASRIIRRELLSIVRQRKTELAAAKDDILSHMLTTTDENGKFFNELQVVDRLLILLLGGYDSTSTVCTLIVKYLAELPQVYNTVYTEQTEISNSKKQGELLTLEDLQKMKYSWNVACEVMRLTSSVGSFREAITDFTFKGFHIPKGWKIFWNPNSTHRNPDCFPDPEKFDPSRFDGAGPMPYTFVPFGGGPRMCPGREYARLKILVFMHNVVRRFRWEKAVPDEKIVFDPIAVPTNGLPVRLYPHTAAESAIDYCI